MQKLLEKEKLIQELDHLEEKSKALKARLAMRSQKLLEDLTAFHEKAKENQKEFESEFEHDMAELTRALKDILKDNVD